MTQQKNEAESGRCARQEEDELSRYPLPLKVSENGMRIWNGIAFQPVDDA